ncbi:T9SS type A sorting domain-containing protein [Nonlabens sp. YIK11]|uniref:T9SS type A sorting domain-containing protein n=1 Tax=Nonlabens sp. YIK11 TaxID=1453349 RepID=UPI000AD60C7B|nr:T9SS type A sorting domain-containing protein [Nonlabens sp. YIK11]
MTRNYFTIIFSFFIATICVHAQQVTYNGNGNTGFGGPVGNGTLQLTDDGTTVTGTFTKGGAGFNDTMVIYISASSTGRTNTVDINDTSDDYRRAVSNANSSAIFFPPGFEVSHAIAINTNQPKLFSIPSNGNVGTGAGNNELNFIKNVGSGFNSGDVSFTFSFNWSDLGLDGSTGLNFGFLATYGNPNDGDPNGMFSSDEALGGGISAGNPGKLNEMTFTQYFDYPQGRTLGIAATASAGFWSSPGVWTNGNPPGAEDQITIQNAVITDVPITIDNSITVNTGSTLTIAANQVMNLNGSLTNNGTTRFASSASGTAQLLNSATATVNGDITVERFIPAANNNRRAFRFVTSAVNTSGSIFANWQDNGNSVPGVGTHITGSETGANGFDATPSGNPSMFSFDNTDVSANQQVAWQPIDNTDVNTLSAGTPYRLFIRGDRNYNLTATPAPAPNSNVVLRATGTPDLDGATFSNLNEVGGNFSLVGNPFQAVVDFRNLTKSNLNTNFIYVWNANKATQGGYETISTGTTDPTETPFLYVQPGQSFFVATAGDGAASIGFELDDRSPSNSNLVTFSNEDVASMKLTLYSMVDGNTVRLDDLKIVFDGDNEININDSNKIFNPEENLSLLKGSSYLAYESRALPDNDEEMQLNLLNYKRNDYSMSIRVDNLASEATAILVDRFLNTEQTLSEGLNNIDFQINNQDMSADADRFYIKFTKDTASLIDSQNLVLKVYPNPTNGDQLNITTAGFDSTDLTLTITNLLGQTIATKAIVNTGNTAKIDVSTIANGMYIFEITDGSTSKSSKVILN